MFKKILILITLLTVITTFYLTAEEQATGLEKSPDKLKLALPQAQPNGIVVYQGAAPGDGKEPQTLPAEVDLSEFLPPIDSQGSIGSCSAWSTIYYSKTLQENMERGWGADEPHEMFSPLFTYNQIAKGSNVGTAIVDHMAIVVDQGCATFATYPDKYDLLAFPSDAAMTEAAGYKAESYESLDTYDYETETWNVSLDKIKTLLASGFPCVVGFTLHESFDDYTTGVYSRIYGSQTGGHAMCIVGYDDDIRALKIVNSWGQWWGDNGFIYISYDIFSELAQWGAGVLYDHVENTRKEARPPVNLNASQGTFSDAIKLTWAEVDETKEYIVFRSKNESGTLEELTRVTTNEFVDTPLPEGVTYIYAVKSISKGRDISDFSPIAEGSTGESKLEEEEMPGIPSTLDYKYNGNMALLLWDEVDNAASYRVYRWDENKEDWLLYGESQDAVLLDKGVRSWDSEPTAFYIISSVSETGTEGYPSEALYFSLGDPANGGYLTPMSSPAPKGPAYKGDFQQKDYFDYEYTMRQFQEFFEAEKKAFADWKAGEKRDFEEFKERENYKKR